MQRTGTGRIERLTLLALGAEVGVWMPVILLYTGLNHLSPPSGGLVLGLLAGGWLSQWLSGWFPGRLPRRLATGRVGAALRFLPAISGSVAVASLLLLGGDRGWDLALLAVLLWWRGLSIAYYTPMPEDLPTVAVRLLTVATATLLARFLFSTPGWSSAAAPYYLLFFSSALAGLAAARAERGRAIGGAVEGGGALASASGAGLLLVPALLIWLTGSTLLPVVARWLATVGGWLWQAATWAAVPLAYLVAWPIMQLISFLRRVLAGREVPASQVRPSGPEWADRLRAAELSPFWQQVLGAAAALVFLAVVALVLYRLSMRLGRRAEFGPEAEERESTFSWRRLWQRLRRPRHASPAPAPAVGSGNMALIRVWYRALQRRGAAGGRARHPAETPLEYATALTSDVEPALPAAAVRSVTAAYVDVRYAERTPGEAELAAARRAAAALGIATE